MKRGKKYRREEIEGYAQQLNYDITTYGEEELFKRIIVLSQVIGKENPRYISIIFVMIGLNNYGNMFECIYTNEPITRFDNYDVNQIEI